MKSVKNKCLVILGIPICLFFLSNCATYTTSSGKTGSSSPHIVFESDIYDFGIAGQEREISHDFVFKNVGYSHLEIKGLRTSCGCVAALSSGETIQPGEAGMIHAAFKTQKYEGKQKKLIYVESNDPENPKIELVMQGSIKSDIAIEPQALQFGNVPKGKTVSKKVKVFDLGKEELQLKRIQFNENHLNIKVDKFEEQNNRGFEIEVMLRPDIPVGLLNEVITLHTNLVKKPRIDVPVLANILNQVQNQAGSEQRM